MDSRIPPGDTLIPIGGPSTKSALARLAYLVVLLIATLSDVVLDPEWAHALGRLGDALDPTIRPSDAVDGARNLLLFAGWGLVWLLTSPVGHVAVATAGATVTGAAISLSVEVVQLFSVTRTASVLDLATNTGGALLGALVVAGVQGLVAGRRPARSYLGLPTVAFAAPYATVVLGEALVPLFRQTPVPGGFGGPVSRTVASMAAFEWSSVLQWPWLDLPLFLPAGVLVVAALAENGVPYRRAAAWTTTGGVLTMATVELAHGVLGLQIVIGAGLLHAVAIALGAVLAIRLVPPFTRRWRGGERAGVVAAAYVVVVLLWILRPYVPETDPAALVEELSSGWWRPLAFLASRLDVYSVMDVVTSFFLYLPIGALLAVWPLRRRGLLRGPLPALYLAAVAEGLQLLVAARTLDITDMLVNGAGVLVGWRLMRRAGFPVRGSMDAE